MTGGVAVILGKTGRNFGAGMSGGLAFIYDVNGLLPGNCNPEMIDLDPVLEEDSKLLYDLINQHAKYTESTVAKFIISDFENQLKHFVKVFPKDYKKVLTQKKNLVSIKK
jgi:glutamate synthase (NADPH/NADH) large chain